jgi:hypothetical protein
MLSDEQRAYRNAMHELGLADDVTFRQQLIRCGKPACKVCKGRPSHGPYWYSEQKTREGRVQTKYIGKHLPRAIAVFVAQYTRTSHTRLAGETASAARLDVAYHDELAQLGATPKAKTKKKPKPRSYATGDRGEARPVKGGCPANAAGHRCRLPKGHPGDHSASNERGWYTWNKNGGHYEPRTTPKRKR